MTKRDLRTRRGLFKGAIRKHRDFDSFQTSYQDQKRQQKKSRIMVLILLIGLIFLTFYFVLKVV